MADLSTVFGNQGDSGINNASNQNQLAETFNSGRNDNNQYNTNDIYNQAPPQPQPVEIG